MRVDPIIHLILPFKLSAESGAHATPVLDNTFWHFLEEGALGLADGLACSMTKIVNLRILITAPYNLALATLSCSAKNLIMKQDGDYYSFDPQTGEERFLASSTLTGGANDSFLVKSGFAYFLAVKAHLFTPRTVSAYRSQDREGPFGSWLR